MIDEERRPVAQISTYLCQTAGEVKRAWAKVVAGKETAIIVRGFRQPMPFPREVNVYRNGQWICDVESEDAARRLLVGEVER